MFLTDQEILRLIKIGVISGYPPQLKEPFSKESHIQPCSIDLTIGKIFVPGSGPNEPGSANEPKTQQHVLRPGQTAVVETAEEFRLPSNVGGFGFPPARVSRNGILMTNPGHIDPGYKGHMSFTLVNMGREDYSLIGGQAICTVLLFRLGEFPAMDYSQRGSSAGSDFAGLLGRLSHDFLNVDERATIVAESKVKEAEFAIKKAQPLWLFWTAVVTAAVAVIGTSLGILANIFVFQGEVRQDLQQLNAEFVSMDQRTAEIEQGLRLEQRLLTLEEVQAIRELLQDQRGQ